MEQTSIDKIYIEIWDNQLFFYKIISKRILFGLSTSYEQFKREHYDSSVPQIFIDSIEVLRTKYIDLDKVKDYETAKRILAKICYFQTLKFSERYMDEQWYRRLRFSDKKNNLYPPSHYYHKTYFEKNKEKINAQRRANQAKVYARKKELKALKKLSTQCANKACDRISSLL